jgi:hypothetical protein
MTPPLRERHALSPKEDGGGADHDFPRSRDSQEGAMQQTAADYAQLDDPGLFGEQRRVREKLAGLPPRHADRARLAAVLDALTDEFDRRARSAWRADPTGRPAL